MGGGKQDVYFNSSLLKDVKWRKKSSVKGIPQAMRRKRNLYLDRVGLQGQGGMLYTDTSLQIKVDSACLTSLSLEIVIISFTSIPIYFFHVFGFLLCRHMVKKKNKEAFIAFKEALKLKY